MPRQASERGWQVRKGEHSTTIFFYKQLQARDGAQPDPGDERPAGRMIPMLRSFNVFHASQMDGIAAYQVPALSDAPWRRPEAADIIMVNSSAVVRTGGERAFYSPGTDHIQLPPDAAFIGPTEWAATALHELAHWTGHPSRMDRDLRQRFGSKTYAQEELRAELASVFIGSEVGLPADIPNHASYLADWITALRGDKREIFRAASEAQRMTDYILAYHPDYKERVLEAGLEKGPKPDEGRQLATVNLPLPSSHRGAGVEP